MNLKAQVEAIIYAAEEPVTVQQIAAVLSESDDRVIGSSDDRNGASADISETSSPVEIDNAVHAETAKKLRKLDPLVSLKADIRRTIDELISDYSAAERGIEIRAIAGGYRMATKPEHHDVVRTFARTLKPPVRLSLPALETLAVIAYKQPVTVPEISEIRGVDSGGVIATLLDRKLITTAGRKQVIGRPILYKTTREFLLRFGLKDLSELPSMEEFEKLMNEAAQEELLPVSAQSSGTQPEQTEAEPQSEEAAKAS